MSWDATNGWMNLSIIKSDGQEISTIEWQELKNEFRLFSDYKKLLRIEEI